MRTDDQVVTAAAELAEIKSAGHPVPQMAVQWLQAEALTRDEQRRHEMAARAAELAGPLTTLAATFLRTVLFGLPV